MRRFQPDRTVTTKWEVKEVGNFVTVVEFNNGYSQLAVDDHCWIILNGGKKTSWIFGEAADVLKQLPSRPDDYAPYRAYLEKCLKLV